MGRLTVVLGLTPVAEHSIEPVLFGRDAVLEPQASAADADDLERAVSESAARAVLLSSDLSGLTSGHCARIRARGVRVVGLAQDSWERQRLPAFGVDDVVAPTDPEEAFLTALRGPVAVEAGRSVLADPGEEPVTESRDEKRGSVLAVVGSKGTPGASECAASLAALAAERWPTVIVELDALGGGLDLRLGADARQGSVLGLARAVAAGDGAVGELLERWLAVREGWPSVLVGAPDPAQALAELVRPGVVAGVLRSLASIYPLVVADVGFLLDEGEGTSPVSRVHREAVVAADAVLLILGAREEQLRAGLDQLDALLALDVPSERLRVAVNGLGGPGAATARAIEAVVHRQLAERRFALDAWLAWDGRALARARRTGIPLAAARGRGRYARALTRLLDELFLPVAPEPRGRKLRLAPPPLEDEAHEEVAAWRS
jgi:hypothetical protein